MDFIVNNTTRISILDLILPYSCRGCGRTGEVLCGRCKKYLVGLDSERDSDSEGLETSRTSGSSRFLNSGRVLENGGEMRLGRLREFYAVGYREGVLRKLVVEYKYSSRRVVSRVLGELVAEVLGGSEVSSASGEVVLVPLPTISRHVRERGFDHTLRLAKEVGRRSGFKVERILRRANRTTQVGTDEATREKQAAEAYEVVGEVDAGKTYLLIDDIWTTGASMRAAAEKMHAAGAREIYGVVVCKGR